MYAANVHPARPGPPPPITVGAQNVDGVTRPENLRSPSASRLDTIPENGLIRGDRPIRSSVVDDLWRVGRNDGAVWRRELTAGTIQFGGDKPRQSVSNAFPQVPSGDQYRAVVQRRRRMGRSARGHVTRRSEPASGRI